MRNNAIYTLLKQYGEILLPDLLLQVHLLLRRLVGLRQHHHRGSGQVHCMQLQLQPLGGGLMHYFHSLFSLAYKKWARL